MHRWILLFILVPIGILGLILLSPLLISNREVRCDMEDPLLCVSPLMGNDGMYIKLGNNGNGDMHIQDVTISKKGGKICRFRRPEIIDNETDFYATISESELLIFWTTADHPDGRCLMAEMVPGNYYDFDIEVTYFNMDGRNTKKGEGTLFYEDLNLADIREDLSWLSEVSS